MTKFSILISVLFFSLNAATIGENWMNPSIGFSADLLADISDVTDQWSKATTQGVQIRSAEFILGASIDPYAKLTANINFSLNGAEIHEMYSWFPYLPASMSLKTGWKLANFGRWNQFHAHALPFTAEPRIYHEYFGGMFMGMAAELSWMAPTPFFLEATLSIYDRIHADSHDSDPSRYRSTIDEKAASMDLIKHGTHWHAPDGSILYEEDLIDPDEPSKSIDNRAIQSLPIGGRVKTTAEMGPNISADIGASGLWHSHHRYSNRVDGQTYSKAVFGSDITLFWHPLSMNNYRNLSIGAEWLLNYEENERLGESSILKEKTWRQGVFAHLHYRHSSRWHFGCYAEQFEAQAFDSWNKKRAGIFSTMEISHYQYLRLEGSAYKQSPTLPTVHRLTLQYNYTIGFHSHGTQR